jgi:integrase
MIRSRRAGVEDLWTKTVRNPDGTTTKMPSKLDGKGSRWRARYVDSRGREHSKGFARKSDAQDWLDGQTAAVVGGTHVAPKRTTVAFGEVAETWFKTKGTRAPKTIAGYRSLLDTVVLPQWKDTALKDIEFEDYQVWITGLSVSGSSKRPGDGLSPSRVIQAHQVVAAVVRFAIKTGRLGTDPTEDVELPKKLDGQQRYLTHEQLHRLAVAAGRFRTMVFVLGYCGLRFGEASALTVGDVDLDGRKISVNKSATYVDGRGMVEGPTKGKTVRWVPVPAFLVELLRTEIGDRAPGERLFAGRGEYLTVGELRWVFDPAATAIHVPGLTPHELRHTCASLAIRAGSNIKVVQRLLGHKTASLTLDRYGHLYGDDLDAVAVAFDVAAASAKRKTAKS